MQQTFNPARWSSRLDLYDAQDISQAAHDLLLMRTRRLKGKPHPAAEILQDPRADFVDLGAAMLRSRGIDFDSNQKRSSIPVVLSSGHLADLLASWGKTLATAQIDESAHDVRRLTTPIELPDYRPVPFPLLATTKLPELTTRDDPSIEMISVTGGGEQLQIASKTFKLLFSRKLIENDDRQIFEAAFLAYGAQVGRRMARDYSAVLENNANLADGNALFNSTDGNDLTSGEISVAALDSMAAALRDRQTSDGEYYNSRPKYLVIPSGKEATARTLTSAQLAMSDDTDRVHVIVSPWLSGTYFYLVADPAQAPSVALATLEGSNGDPVTTLASASPRASFENLPNGLRESFDGAAVDVRIAFGLAPVERNIIRNTTS